MVKTSPSRRWLRAGGAAVVAVGLAAGVVTGQATASPRPNAAKGAPAHIFVIMMENHGFKQIVGNSAMPSVGFQGEYAPVINGTTIKLFAQKHNPFMYFSDINSPNDPRLNNIVPLETSFSSDLASGSAPDFVWVSPDQCHDMHGVSPASAALIGLPACGYPASGLDHGAIQLGDTFVRSTVDQIIEHIWHLGCLANTCSPAASGTLEQFFRP